ncbi:hypothetical protein K470DRAFT_277790 [Piedraia hortae CBS 480.64]|uniref:AA1-like domain-containing protein n=1 Tax=Piedraia hortae CBS 480.64 TaxID=1314780 RepID=A0A6A7BVF8_9PEZI|nr:hypothetical protein K470DRAFT_277790 [Piedraia hortae CBS 480.64]
MNLPTLLPLLLLLLITSTYANRELIINPLTTHFQHGTYTLNFNITDPYGGQFDRASIYPSTCNLTWRSGSAPTECYTRCGLIAGDTASTHYYARIQPGTFVSPGEFGLNIWEEYWSVIFWVAGNATAKVSWRDAHAGYTCKRRGECLVKPAGKGFNATVESEVTQSLEGKLIC